MTVAKSGDTVAVHYVGRFEDGELFDSSQDRDPLTFELGKGQVITGFDEAVEGMEAGEEKQVRVASEQAYGPYREDLVVSIPRDAVPAEIEPVVGKQVEMQLSDGQRQVATIAEVEESSLVLDANHPLAGKDLLFDLTLVSVSESP